MAQPLFVDCGVGALRSLSRAPCSRCPALLPRRRRPYSPLQPGRVPTHASSRLHLRHVTQQASESDWRSQNGQLTSAARRNGVDAAVSLLSEMTAAGTAMTQNYNQVISLLIAQRRFEDAFKLAMDAADRGLSNIVTFRPLMKHCCGMGNGKGAKRVWRVMCDLGIEGDMFVYAELMGALVRAQDLAAADNVISSLTDAGMKPHIVLYNTLLKGVAKKADVRKAFAVLGQLTEIGVRPDETTFNTVINTCVRAKDATALGKAMALMRQSGIKPGVPTFNTLLKLYARSKNFQNAMQIFNEMQQSVEPSIVTYNTLIDGCAHRGDMTQAAQFFDEMIDRGMAPDICTMTSLLKGFGRANEPARAVELYEAMKEGEYDIEDRTRYAVLNACLRSGDRRNAKRLLAEMLAKEGFDCRLRTYVWLVETDVAADDYESARDTLELMLRHKVTIDEQSKGVLLREMRERGGFSSVISKLNEIPMEQ